MIIRQACSNPYTLPHSTLLAMLESKIDTTRAIVVATDEVIDLTGMDYHIYRPKINSGEWVYYEEYQPRRLLLTNPNWSILSFDPPTRLVCVQLFTPNGTRMLNFTLPELSPKLSK